MPSNNQKPYINVDFFEDLTGNIEKTEGSDIEEIGIRIKKIREEKGLSIEDISKITGFDTAFLSKIENNQAQPQLGTIIRLSKALDSAFSRLVSGTGSKLYSITRKNEQKIISRSTGEKGRKQLYTYKSLAPEVKGRHMEALMVELEENPDQEMSVHGGEEFIYVIHGMVRLKIGDELFDLEPGDSAYYLSTTPHIIASKKGKALILAVLYEG